MGNVIRKDAAAEAIVSDLRVALTNGNAQGGKMKEICDAELGPMLTLADSVESELNQARAVFLPLNAALVAANDKADDDLQRVYDETYNDVGRPRYDPGLSLIFPGGASYYADGDVDEQPLRMELLARLFEKGLHPKLSQAQGQAKAAAVRAAAAPLKAAVEAAGLAAGQVKLLEKVWQAVAKSCHAALLNAKRMMKNAGFGETEIHAVIPDRPGSSGTRAG